MNTYTKARFVSTGSIGKNYRVIADDKGPVKTVKNPPGEALSFPRLMSIFWNFNSTLVAPLETILDSADAERLSIPSPAAPIEHLRAVYSRDELGFGYFNALGGAVGFDKNGVAYLFSTSAEEKEFSRFHSSQVGSDTWILP